MDFSTLPQALRELIEVRQKFYNPNLDEKSECLDCKRKDGTRHWRCDTCACGIHTGGVGLSAFHGADVGGVGYRIGPFEILRDRDGFLCKFCLRDYIAEWCLVDWEKSLGVNRTEPTRKPSAGKSNTYTRDKVAPSVRYKVFKRDGFRCVRCAAKSSDGHELVIDHKVPVAKGGSNEEVNLQTLCWKCNSGKRDALDAGSVSTRGA